MFKTATRKSRSIRACKKSVVESAPTDETQDSDSGHAPTSSSDSESFYDLPGTIDESGITEQNKESAGDELRPHDADAFWQSRADADGDATVPLPQRLAETSDILRLALNNKFVTALEIASRRSQRELYAGLATATLSFLRCAFTLEPEDLKATLEAVNGLCELSSARKRRTSTAGLVMRLIYRPNYKLYSDDECHAELVHAEALLMLSLVSFLCDQSLICLVKGAFRLRSCYQRYKECLHIMESREQWQSPEGRLHFESGVRMGYGTFNLLMSYLPARVLRILEYVGFSGDRSLGVDELERSVACQDGLRSVFGALVILTYHTYVESIFGLGRYDALKVRQLNSSLLEQFPNSAFFLLFQGRYQQMQGDLPAAIESLRRAEAAQDDWKQFHSLCHWDTMWCHASLMNWQQAAHYSDLLRRHSKWSPASYTYQYATFLYADLVERERSGACAPHSAEHARRLADIKAIMKRVPELRIRYAGKTIPAEKFAITRSMKFFAQDGRLTLPALEFLYVWNIFPMLANNPTQTGRILARIDSELEFIEARIAADEAEKAAAAGSQKNEHDEQDDEQDDKQDGKQDGKQEEEPEEASADEADDEDFDYARAEQRAQGASNSRKSGQPEPELSPWLSDRCLGLLLKAMCLKQLKRLPEAEECCARVLQHESHIREQDTFLLPHSAMELALLKLDQRQYESSRRWVKRARNNYTGYLLETIVHFRLHAASRQIRLESSEAHLSASSESAASSGETPPAGSAAGCHEPAAN